MRITLLSVAVAIGPVSAYGGKHGKNGKNGHPPTHFDTWSPPGSGDSRAPCPMLNTLANHGFLPHDGKAITVNDTVDALYDALHIDKEMGSFLFDFAVTTNPDENATTFDLAHLGRHNVLEHDASLSRADFYWGEDPISFNETVFEETRSYWTDSIIDIQMAANARLARLETSMSRNPTFEMSDLGEAFGFGESIAYILALGDRKTGTVARSWVEYLFEQEMLPLELGWSRTEEPIHEDDLTDMMDKIMVASGIEPEEPERLVRRGAFHAGM